MGLHPNRTTEQQVPLAGTGPQEAASEMESSSFVDVEHVKSGGRRESFGDNSGAGRFRPTSSSLGS